MSKTLADLPIAVATHRELMAGKDAQIALLTKQRDEAINAMNWARARLSLRDAAEFVANFGPLSLDAAISSAERGK